jgi:branched-chain amino acid transport system permease protein
VEIVSSIVHGILLGGFYALMAAGLSIAFGVMRIVNVAHGDLAVVAAYMALVVVNATGVNPFLTLLVVPPIMFAAGYVLQRGLLDFTLERGVLPPLLVTFGVSIVLQNLLQQRFTADAQGLHPGSIEGASLHLGGVSIGWLPLLTFGAGALMLVSLHLLFTRTRLGRGFRAVSDDTETARLMGMDDRHLFGLAFGLALAAAAVSGTFLAMRTTVTPTSGPAQLLVAFEAVIIGGLGSLSGTLLGGVVLGITFSIGEQAAPGWGVLAQHLVFLAVLAFRPTGLIAARTRTA